MTRTINLYEDNAGQLSVEIEEDKIVYGDAETSDNPFLLDAVALAVDPHAWEGESISGQFDPGMAQLIAEFKDGVVNVIRRPGYAGSRYLFGEKFAREGYASDYTLPGLTGIANATANV